MAADTFLTHSMIAKRALFDLQNQLTFSRHAYKGYSAEFHSAIGGYKKGNSVTIHLPNKFRAYDGPLFDDIHGIQENSTTVTVDKHKYVGMDFLETDLTFNIADFSRKYIRPATIALANKVDADGCGEYVNIANLVGTPGTTPATFKALADAALMMDNEAVPRVDRVSVFSPKAHWSMADGELKALFNQQLVETMVRKGFIGKFALMDVYMDQNITSHLVGNHDADWGAIENPVTFAEGATSIITDSWAGLTTGILNKGDIITIAGCAAVNPISGSVWEGSPLRQFVVTADATDDGAGNSTIAVWPRVISAAGGVDLLPYQTVDAFPVAAAEVQVVGTSEITYPQNLCFHPDCFALTVVPLATPKSANKSVMWAQTTDPQMGLSITIATGFDLVNYDENTRLDILYGWDTPRPELGVRITG